MSYDLQVKSIVLGDMLAPAHAPVKRPAPLLIGIAGLLVIRFQWSSTENCATRGFNPSSGSGVPVDTAAQSNGAIGHAIDRATRRMRGGRDMPPGKAAKNEREYPYVVEFVVAGDKLDVELSRRMMHFHRSRKIPARHGRRIFREGQIFFRWCFSDLATARAFREQFDGEVAATRVMKAGRLASNIVAVIAPASWRWSLD